jgi:hypothetical protein
MLSYERIVLLEVTSCDLVEYVRRFIESYYPICIHSRLHAFGSQVYQDRLNVMTDKVPCASGILSVIDALMPYYMG